MKNRYLFFKAETFDDLDLSDYTKEDTQIPETDVHIYTFAYTSTDESIDDEFQAKKLDELTQLIIQKYEEKFQVVDSESSQYFCRELYPYIQSFETRLRYALYIARSLYDPKSLNNKSFLLSVATNNKKEDLPLEALDFSQIYTAVFTDAQLKTEANKKYDTQLTKAEWIRRIESIPEKTLWHDWVGYKYDFVEDNFLAIKNIRNDVMHNHLINFNDYTKAKDVLKKANDEIEQVIGNKLLVNGSAYATTTNIWDTLGGAVKALQLLGTAMSEVSSNQTVKGLGKVLEVLTTLALPTVSSYSDESDCDEISDCKNKDTKNEPDIAPEQEDKND